MKLLVVFNAFNDIVFCHAKHTYLTSLLTNFKGEPVQAANAWEQLDCLVQMFSPLVATHNLMRTQLQSTYQRISLSNSEEIAFRRSEDFIMIGVFSRKTFCQPERQLAHAERQMRCLVGPYFETLKCPNLQHREGAFSLLSALIVNWKTFVTHELAFTFAAVERLKVSGDIKEKAVESIERSFQRHRKQLATVEHALVVCGTKLLCLYSTERTSRLVAQDFLCLISFMQALFPKFDAYDDYRAAEAPEIVSFGSCAEGSQSSNTSDSNKDELSSSFHSCPEPPAQTPTSSQSRSPDAAGAYGDRSSQATFGDSPLERNPYYPIVQQVELDKTSLSESKAALLFLSTTASSMVPFKVYFVPVTNNVVFIALESVEPRSVAKLVDRLHRCADRIEGHVSQQSDLASVQTAVGAELKSLRRLLLDIARVLRASPQSAKFCAACERNSEDIERHCERVEAKSFRSVDLYISAVENLAQKVKDTVKRIFESLFLQFPFKVSATTCQCVQLCARNLRRDLQDYLPFLDVKSRRNLAASSVLTSFAGMLHFALVDRRSDEIVSPTPDWGRHPQGLPRRMLQSVAALRDAAASLKTKEKEAPVEAPGGVARNRKEIYLYRRDQSFQFSYLMQWERLRTDAQLVDPGFELVAVHHASVERPVIHQQLLSLVARFLGSRDSPDTDSTLL